MSPDIEQLFFNTTERVGDKVCYVYGVPYLEREDVISQARLRFLQAGKKIIMPSEDLRRYFFQTTKSVIFNQARKNATENRFLNGEKVLLKTKGFNRPIEEMIILREEKEELVSQINQLSEKKKQVVELLASGYSQMEISGELGLERGTVKKRIFDLRRELADTIDNC